MSVLTYLKQFNHRSDLTWDCSKGFDRPLFESSVCRRTECRDYRCPTPERDKLKRRCRLYPGAGRWHSEQMANGLFAAQVSRTASPTPSSAAAATLLPGRGQLATLVDGLGERFAARYKSRIASGHSYSVWPNPVLGATTSVST